MHKFVTQRLVVAWIALLGVLFAALSPTISHAMGAATPAAAMEVEVCTAQGMVVVALDEAPDRPAPAPDHMAKHCPYCAVHGGAPALLPAHAFAFPVLARDTSHPPLFYRSATPLFAWSAANPRAPPAMS